MTTKYFLTIINGIRTLVSAISASAGATDGNKIISTNTSGKLDISLIQQGISSIISHSTASININLANGNMIAIALTQNTTIASITGVPSGKGVEFTIICTQDATGGRPLYFPTGTTVTGTISFAPNSTSIIKVFSFNSGVNWDAIVIKPISEVIGATPPDSFTMLLLRGDGTSGSSNFVDSSTDNNIVVPHGNAMHSTSYKKFGVSSIYLDGTGDYLTISTSRTINIRTDIYTIECWFYTTASHNFSLVGDNDFYPLQYSGGTWYVGDNYTNIIGYPNPLTLNTWTHIALSFDGTTYRLFINGSIVGQSSTLLRLYTFSLCHIGTRISQNYYFNGFIDDVRISKGVARYTSGFTPPTDPF